jgi:hypothetical protein
MPRYPAEVTAIVGVEHDGVVWLAGDAEFSSKRVRNMLAIPKVWERDGLVWGFAGASRPGELIRYELRTPRKAAKTPVDAYVVTELIPAMRALWKADGCEESEWAALVGIGGELWELDSDGYSSDRPSEGYASVGSAQGPALVGLALTANLAPRTRVTRVVAACAKHCPGVGGRITVVKTS